MAARLAFGHPTGTKLVRGDQSCIIQCMWTYFMLFTSHTYSSLLFYIVQISQQKYEKEMINVDSWLVTSRELTIALTPNIKVNRLILNNENVFLFKICH